MKILKTGRQPRNSVVRELTLLTIVVQGMGPIAAKAFDGRLSLWQFVDFKRP